MSHMNQMKKILTNLDLNPGYLIRLVPDWWAIVWPNIYFKCQAFCWWVMWWWSRVTCCPISKDLLSRYRRRCMYLMYCQRKYLLYLTNIGWIIDRSDVCRIVLNELIRVGMIWINVNRVGTFVIQNYRTFCPTLPFQFFNGQHFRKCYCLQRIHFHLLICHTMSSPCRQYLTIWKRSQRCISCLYC